MISFLYILLVVLLVLANGFFVASEFALVGVRRSRVEMLVARGSRGAKRLLTTAAVIMSIFLIASSIVTTLLIPPAEFQPGGGAAAA